MIKIAVFASGNGSNALNLYQYFKNHSSIVFDSIYCNNPKAGIIEKSKDNGIPLHLFNKEEWLSGKVTSKLLTDKVDFIILAGFLWLVPSDLISRYKDRIINIHPSLLPKYGGKGMFGMKVHESIVANQEKETGITIHLVNEEYDKGRILFQTRIPVKSNESPENIAQNIHLLEHRYFPITIENYINNSQ